MKKNILFFGIACIVIIGFAIICSQKNTEIQIAKEYYFENNVDDTINKSDFQKNNSNFINKEDIIITSMNDASFKRNISDNTLIKNDSDLIIIGNIDSIEGTINYNPTTNRYTVVQTIGSLNVDKILKGNLSENKIPFIKAGGIISVEDYEKGLSITEKSKLGLDKLGIDEKKSKYVEECFSDDIKPEKNKEYLIYLKYSSDYNRYAISFMKYGLREVSINTNLKQMYTSKENLYDNLENIVVKNNSTGEWEALSTII